jgi:hypothetical protein
MRSRQIKKYINMSPNAIGIDKYTKRYRDHHSKFIHSSWLLLEDLGRTVTLPDMHGSDTTYEIFGVWDADGSRVKIMLKDVNGGPFLIEESKIVSQALGYTRMRNAVNGEEHKWDYINQKQHFQIMSKGSELLEDVAELGEEEITDAFGDSFNEDEEEYVDPLVKALQDELTDDGDSSAL